MRIRPAHSVALTFDEYLISTDHSGGRDCQFNECYFVRDESGAEVHLLVPRRQLSGEVVDAVLLEYSLQRLFVV